MHCEALIIFVANFHHFAKKKKGKKILSQILCLNKIITRYCHNCLQYERVLKVFYFHILDITKYS
jgi:hypothetical protein